MRSPEKVKEIRGARLFVREADRPGVQGGEFLVTDVVGCKVVVFDGDDENEKEEEERGNEGEVVVVGVVSAVILRQDINSITNGPDASLGNDILEIRRGLENGEMGEDEGSEEEGESFLLPFVRELVPRIDLERRTVCIRLPEGLAETTKVNRKPEKFLPRGLLCAAQE